MTLTIRFDALTEPDLTRLAEEVAFMLAPGDVVTLDGDLGAGKSTFARALIRAAMKDPALDVPSPTFTLVQTYETPRFPIAHVDLYRLTSPTEIDELGIDLHGDNGVSLIEWPQRAGERLGVPSFAIEFAEASGGETRDVAISANNGAAARLRRMADIRSFLRTAAGDSATELDRWSSPHWHVSYLQGDASPRRYARLTSSSCKSVVLMDSPAAGDGPAVIDGLPYSRIAHLAEDVRPFVAMADALRTRGIAAPEIHAADLDAGLLLIEDFGDRVFGAEVKRGMDQSQLWNAATDALVALRRTPPDARLPVRSGDAHTLATLNSRILGIETALLLDWYWLAAFGSPPASGIRAAYEAAWAPLFDRVIASPPGWMLRDYHSPNLIALAGRPAPANVGVIDFQDAMIGPPAYDLVSLLQDARVDVDAALEASCLSRYLAAVATTEPRFDESDFRAIYAILGAQRATKILGIFARLSMRDGKRQYLAHIPRIWGYLARNLAHADLAALRAWYDTHIPLARRDEPLDI